VIGYRRALLKLGEQRWLGGMTKRVFAPADAFLYSRSGGRLSLTHLGSRRGALQTLLLTTTGRKTGQQRTTPVLYLEHGDSVVVVASNFGTERHPAWSANLLADPSAAIQVRNRHRRVRARQATEEEKEALWPRLLEVYPTWEVYRGKTDRTFRAFFLESV
jgi:deazaflavin-dependent oxidoreductase (nitroreductase family)